MDVNRLPDTAVPERGSPHDPGYRPPIGPGGSHAGRHSAPGWLQQNPGVAHQADPASEASSRMTVSSIKP